MDHLHLGFPLVLTAQIESEFSTAFWTTRILISIWALISTFEWIVCMDLFQENGILSWRILRLRRGFLYRHRFSSILFGRPSIRVLVALRLLASVSLLVGQSLFVDAIGFAVLIFSNWYFAERCWLGADGSDQMGNLVAMGALIMTTGFIFRESSLTLAGILLIGGELVLAYAISGVAKLVSPTWRCGYAVIGVVNTASYGNAVVGRFASRCPRVSRACSWGVILTETLFPIAVLFPERILPFYLLCLILLHLSIAVIMGLNTFLWAFIAAYPSVIALSHLLHNLLRTSGK